MAYQETGILAYRLELTEGFDQLLQERFEEEAGRKGYAETPISMTGFLALVGMIRFLHNRN